MQYVKDRYNNKTMIITENGNKTALSSAFVCSFRTPIVLTTISGYASPGNEENDFVHDEKRIQYHQSYLAYLAQAMRYLISNYITKTQDLYRTILNHLEFEIFLLLFD